MSDWPVGLGGATGQGAGAPAPPPAPPWGQPPSPPGWGQPSPGWTQPPQPAWGGTPAPAAPEWGANAGWADHVAAPSWAAYGAAPAREYAGFWRRFWGLHVDGWVVNAKVYAANFLLWIGFQVFSGAFQTCTRSSNGFYVVERCSVADGVAWGYLGFNVLLNATLWYRTIPRRMGLDGYTTGMHQLGLVVSDASTGARLGVGRAFGRAILAGLLQIVPVAALIAAGVVLLLAETDGSATSDRASDVFRSAGVAALFLAPVAWLLPTVWSVFDRRRQTLYDKAVGSVVQIDHPVSWWAVTAWATTFLIPIFPVGIVAGHLGRAEVRNAAGRMAGGGIALAALIVSYIQLVVVVVVVVLLELSVGSSP